MQYPKAVRYTIRKTIMLSFLRENEQSDELIGVPEAAKGWELEATDTTIWVMNEAQNKKFESITTANAIGFWESNGSIERKHALS